MKHLFVVGSVLCFVAQMDARAGGPEQDKRVKASLERAGMKFDVTPDGDYKLGIAWSGEKRSHIVFIESRTQSLRQLELRDVCAAGFVGDVVLSDAIMTRLLERNAAVKMGAWQAQHFGRKVAAMFCAKVPADSDGIVLGLAVTFVATEADDVEKALTGKDDL